MAKNTLPDAAPADAYSYLHPYAHYDTVLRDYSRWLLTLNEKDVRVIDLNGPLSDYVMQQRTQNPNFCFSGDGIHPDDEGHLLMAWQFLKGMGIFLDDGAPAAHLAAVKADPLFSLVSKHEQIRANGWLDYTGYTRGQTVKTDSIDATEREAAAIWKHIEQEISKRP